MDICHSLLPTLRHAWFYQDTSSTSSHSLATVTPSHRLEPFCPGVSTPPSPLPHSWPKTPRYKPQDVFGKHPPRKQSKNTSSCQVPGWGPRFKEAKKKGTLPILLPFHKLRSLPKKSLTPPRFPHTSNLQELLHGRRGAEELPGKDRRPSTDSGALGFPISLLPCLKSHLQEPSAETQTEGEISAVTRELRQLRCCGAATR